MRTLLSLLFVAALALTAQPSHARRHHHADRETSGDATTSPGQFDYYLLSLSWSPSYCQYRPNDRSQCGNRRFGFVLHGLWPQYRDGGYPQQCAGDPSLPDEVQRRMLPIMPSTSLIAHEWSRHGTCSGLSPQAYFQSAERAFGSIRTAPIFQADPIPQSLDAGAILQAIHQANPAIPADGIALKCRGPELEEVRVCLSRDLRPTSCGRGVRTQCRAGPIQIRPVR